MSSNTVANRFKKFFFLLLREEKKVLWSLVIYGIWVSICSLIIPIAVQTFVNTIGFGMLTQPILILAILVFAFLTFSGALQILQVSVTEVFQQRLFAKIAMELANRVPRIQLSIFKESYGTEWVNRFFDVLTLQKTCSVLILDGAALFLQVLFGMILLALYHPFLLALNFLIVIVVSLFFFGLEKSAIETSIQESKSKYSVAAWLQELGRNAETFRSEESRKFALSSADQLTTQYITSRRKHFRVLFKQIIAAITLQIFASSLLLGVGGWLVVKGQLTLGQLVASELILSSVVAGIGKFGKYLESYYDLAAALDKIGEVFELPIERVNEQGFEEPKLSSDSKTPLLRLKNFRMENQASLPEINFEVFKNSKIAIIGPSGSGKSELIHQIYGLCDGYSGVIEIDGVNLKHSSLETVRSKIFLVTENSLTEGTLLENIRFGRSPADSSLHAIEKVLVQLGLDEKVHSLPEGLNTRITAGRFPFSKLEAKKIALARALIANPKVLLLDHIVDDFDSETDLAWKTFLSKKDFPFAMILTSRKNHCAEFCDTVISLNSLRKGPASKC